jgi:glycosidase
VNPDAYLVGEIWWLQWPDKFLDPAVYLAGDQFDAIMNYRWYRVARGFFGRAEPVLTPTGFVSEIKRIDKGINESNLDAMMNVAATHDTPRLSTSLYNKTMDKYNAKPSENPDYKINKPDELTRREQILLLVGQFTFIGAPHIWNGDEVGMWGADDPDCRKPVVWSDITYEDEKAAYDPSKTRPADKVSPDTALLTIYKGLTRMRRDNPVLSYGELNFIVADDQKMILAYTRTLGKEEIVAMFNRSGKEESLFVPVQNSGTFTELLSPDHELYKSVDKGLEIKIEPLSAMVLRRN